MAQTTADSTVTLLGPSFLMYGDETSTTQATAVFTNFSTHPPVISEVPLSKDAFAKVGGGQIGGPTLTQINITDPPDDLIIPLRPLTSLTTGPWAWAVLQPPLPDSIPPVYELNVFVDGKNEIVKFTNAIPNAEAVPSIEPVRLEDGAVYNDLEEGLLSVTYLIPGGKKETAFVERGQDVFAGSGVFTGDIVSFNIESTALPVAWGAETSVTTGKGLPVLVWGKANAPKLAVVRVHGNTDIVELREYLQ
jgi:hypothetical protein